MKRTLIITLALALALGVQRHVHVGKNDKLISAQASEDNLSFFINDNLLSAQRHVCVGTP